MGWTSHIGWRRLGAAAAFLGLGLGLPTIGTAQDEPIPAALTPYRAQLTPVVVAGADSTQHYALLLPANYQAPGSHPLLLLLDPRGRAMVPLARFGPTASRLGFVVMSSYNTLSDGAVEPNVAAVNAMLADATRALAFDPYRVYLAGFSGTARLAYAFAIELPGVVRGVIGSGAGPIPIERIATALGSDTTFLVYATAGSTDFNHDEVIGWNARLDAGHNPHRTVILPGEHNWLSADIAADALEWIDLHHGQPSAAQQAQYRDRRIAELDSLVGADDPLAAVRALGELARDFPSDSTAVAVRRRPDLRALDQKAGALRRRQDERIRDDAAWTRRGRAILASLLVPELAWSVDRIADSLGLARIQHDALKGSVADRASAQRRLEWAFVNATFYGPRTYAAQQAWATVLLQLDLGRRIHPLYPEACQHAVAAMGALHLGPLQKRYPECAPSTARP